MKISERLLQILKSKTELTTEQIELLSEREGWAIVYSLRPEATKKEKRIEVCFTGFSPSDKSELIKIAQDNDIHVAKSVTKELMFLCCGENAGPSKMSKAEKQGVKLINKDDFFKIIETGEIPNR
jgi:NAD-dependent DNA ligase